MLFNVFKQAVAAQFAKMQQYPLFRTGVDKDARWAEYLNSFPEGTNPKFRERTEHDCQCCRSFIRSVGDVVAIIDGKMVSIWDVKIGGFYQVVADAMSALVKSEPIKDVFLHTQPTAGVNKNYENSDDGVITWEHFFINIPDALIVKEDDLASTLGEIRSTYDVMFRGLTELTVESLDTVLELIDQNSLLRGAEHKGAVEAFLKLKQEFDAIEHQWQKEWFCWTRVKTVAYPVARIRNSAIGSLLVDLSNGDDLEGSVKSYETKVGGDNYKRPTALVTESMKKKAKEKIQELGLMSALERRYASINDITINNILFADRAARKVIEGDVFDTIGASAVNLKSFDKVEEVTIENFIANILPKADSIEVMLENRHSSNLVSLIAPVDPTARNMFKWDNRFSWSYTGDVADSIKERVKAAGGNVTGELCCRLAWDYADDLDFHMKEPDGGHIHFGNRRSLSRCGGMLDVDANGIDGPRPNPVENIFYNRLSTMKEGQYDLIVHNYSRRSDGVGFVVELDILGDVSTINYNKTLKSGEQIRVARFNYTKAGGLKIVESLPSSSTSKNVWNVPTQTFNKVNVVMMSPNFWDGREVGNKHYFFMLENCLNDGQARGFYNEFLIPELNEHRKVLEIVGSKMKTEESDKQLSGLGFSSTQRNSVLCRVKGSFSRVVKIVF